MPDEKQPEIEEQKPDQSDATENTGKEPGPIPYERFKEVNEGMKALKSELEELRQQEQERQDKAKQAAEKRLEEQQKFAELAEQRKAELDAIQGKNTDYEKVIDQQTEVLQALYDARKTAVPEMFQPLLDAMSLTDRLRWLAENEGKLIQPDKGNGIPKTPAPNGKGDLTDDQRRRMAARTF